MGNVVLVTGGNGFVGSHLVEALVRRNYRIRCLVRKKSDLRWIKGLPIEYFEGDVTFGDGLERALTGVDLICHLAGLTKARTSEEYHAVNSSGTRNLMAACFRVNPAVKRVVVMSSLAAFGPAYPDRPRTEEDPPKPVSDYGRSKLQGELSALGFADRLPITILRPSAVYGPRDTDVYAFFRLMSFRLNARMGKGERYVSLCHVHDLIKAAMLAVEKKGPSGEAFFISDGEVYTWSGVTGLLAKIMGITPLEPRIPEWAAFAAAYLSELGCSLLKKPPLFNRQKVIEMTQGAWTCDITRARNVLGFRPSVSLQKGLEETWQWYRENGWL
jgi:nucleoside-diphosphate-sugar epimerase